MDADSQVVIRLVIDTKLNAYCYYAFVKQLYIGTFRRAQDSSPKSSDVAGVTGGFFESC